MSNFSFFKVIGLARKEIYFLRKIILSRIYRPRPLYYRPIDQYIISKMTMPLIKPSLACFDVLVLEIHDWPCNVSKVRSRPGT